ncbi:MAG: insulinase family protein [Firmicutes bacterium]|nr:insulinase family protein [Bacillota bacterium]
MKPYRIKKFGFNLLVICLMAASAFLFPSVQGAPDTVAPKISGPQVRDDGLTVLVHEIPKKDSMGIDFLTMIVKTGYAHDPPQLLGLNELTAEIISHYLRYSEALVSYITYSEFTVYRFTVIHNDYSKFCRTLDAVISAPALLEYDLCNQLIRNHQIKPRLPGKIAAANLAELVYGDNHPYALFFKPNYANLDINAVNQWFRKIYRPANLLIASTHQLPGDFLRKPSGRDLKEAAPQNPVPPPWKAAGETLTAGKANAPLVKFSPFRDNLSHICLGFPGPRIGDAGFFAMILITRFLDEELKRQIREESAFCYDIKVSYAYLERATAPLVEITLQTLPSDTEAAVAKITAVLKKIAREGLPEEQLTRILNREKLLVESQDGVAVQTMNKAWDALFSQNWFANPPSYLSQLTKASSAVKDTMNQYWPHLRVSIAGPPESEPAAAKILELIR